MKQIYIESRCHMKFRCLFINLKRLIICFKISDCSFDGKKDGFWGLKSSNKFRIFQLVFC